MNSNIVKKLAMAIIGIVMLSGCIDLTPYIIDIPGSNETTNSIIIAHSNINSTNCVPVVESSPIHLSEEELEEMGEHTITSINSASSIYELKEVMKQFVRDLTNAKGK